ncbi:MAG: tail protein X [Brevundimonas sp.]|uniref:tail protein X n=1 Tax=Brevundimonas sp. TaxID=1871086 RepID=UPI00272808AF|nr:tail protein X [Brevundimonas sp.]MDO9607231.1 tail protein X [Brevundimonas sp.]
MAGMSAPLIRPALEGETVDALITRVLGLGSSALTAVYEANPNLADGGLFLKRGQLVVLPVSATKATEPALVQLWD